MFFVVNESLKNKQTFLEEKFIRTPVIIMFVCLFSGPLQYWESRISIEMAQSKTHSGLNEKWCQDSQLCFEADLSCLVMQT